MCTSKQDSNGRPTPTLIAMRHSRAYTKAVMQVEVARQAGEGVNHATRVS